MPRDEQRLDQYLESWRQDLIDLSRRNRLINLPLGPRSGVLEIKAPRYDRVIVGLSASGGRGWRFHYPPVADGELSDDPGLLGILGSEDPDLAADLKPDELLTSVSSATLLSARLRTLANRANTEFIDRGLRVLYLTVGILKWDDGDPKGLSSPLVLIPVQLDRASPRDPYRLVVTDEESVANPALAAKLQDEFGIELPELDPDDVPRYLRDVAKTVHKLGWTVEEQCAVATLSFVKETIYRDLIENEDEIKGSNIVRAITLGGVDRSALEFSPISPTSDELDRSHPPEGLNSVLDADGTQRACIVAAKEGKSFVMDGPPGSGKSQTITNIIAELLADGKTVLFVSEKVAALEVVKNRLDDARLGEFILELHSHKATRKAVAGALGGSLRRVLQLPRVRQINEQQLRDQRIELSRYATAINRSRFIAPHVRNLHDAIGRCGQLTHLPTLPFASGIGKSLTPELFSEINDISRQLANAWGPVSRGEDFLWRDLAEQAIHLPQSRINVRLAEVIRLGDAFSIQLREFSHSHSLDVPRTLSDARRLVEVNDLIESRPTVDQSWLLLNNCERLLEETISLSHDAERCQEIRRDFAAQGIEVDSVVSDTSPLNTAAKEAKRYMGHESSLEQVRQARNASLRLGSLSASLAAETEAAAELLGISTSGMSISTAEAIVELIDLGDQQYRPVTSWLSHSGVQQVQSAISAVQPLLEEWRATEKRLLEYFNENIKTVDISAFYDSETDVAPKIGRLAGRGRKNRKQLEACIKTGKISKEIITLPPVVRMWKKLTSRLEDIEDGSVLGAYFAGPATDLDAVAVALDAAKRALELAGQEPNRERLGRVIGRDALLGPEVNAARAKLEELLEEWSVVSVSDGVVASPQPGQRLSLIEHQHQEIAEVLGLLAAEMEPFCADSQTTIGAALTNAEQRALLATLEGKISSFPGGQDLGEAFKGLATSWSTLTDSLRWVVEVRKSLLSEIEPGTARSLCDLEKDQELHIAFVEYRAALTQLLELFSVDYREKLEETFEGSLDDARETLEALRITSADIEEWRIHTAAIERLKTLGFGEMIERITRQQVSADDIPEIVEKTVLNGWVDELLLEDEGLRLSRRQDRDEVLQRFRDLDRQLHLKAAARVIETCNSRRPAAIAGEYQVVEREGQKKSKHMPVRDLLARASSAVLNLKPCFMMSPLSVSQFLPADLRFDCVIFDEASQVKPADAINAVYRGRQVIIAGDEKQLPPTSFFDRGVQDDDIYDEEEVDEFESILSLSKAGLVQLPLRWHYRSRHESLISFSNREYYNSELVTFPGAIQESDDLGVHFEHVPEGVYARGGSKDNVAEARRVVERILHHATLRPDRSVGVIAFSDAQASRITVELEAIRRSRPDLDEYFAQDRLDGFFVKNIESVQGDERDVVIFSIGYGRDEHGKFTMNFGPVGREGGERRLNVAITRARERVEIVSSVRAADFQETSNPRVQSLKRYLDYAERGIPAFADDGVTGAEPDSPFEEDVIAVVRELGCEPRPQVGQAGYRIDIGVVHPTEPGRYILGVECDGATYHSSQVARDRDRLRQDVLEGLGWTIHRIWSTSWFRDRRSEIRRLREAIDTALSSPSVARQPRQRRPIPEPEVVEVEQEIAPWASEYSTSELTRIRAVRDFGDVGSAAGVRELLARVVTVLQPVHLEQVETAVKAIQGFQTMSASRKQFIAAEMRSLVRKGDLFQDRHHFYWAKSEQQVVVRSGNPNKPDSVRKAAHVSPDEVKLALFWLTRDGHSVDEEELLVQTARLFGWMRRGPDVESLLLRALAGLLKNGDLVRLGDYRLTAADREAPDLS